MIRFAVVVAWATLLVVLVGLAVGGCGSVDLVAAVPDAAPEADADVASHTPSPSADASEAAPETAATDARHEAASCASSTMLPYCASCRDSRGVCMCGALPCCDQRCQS